MNNTHPLHEFLQYLPGQKEIALVISHDSKELGSFTELLEAQGFVPAYSVIEMLQSVKGGKGMYLLADSSLEGQPKELYDLAAQYPTGQVQIWDDEKKVMVTISPSYTGLPPIFLTNIQNLTEFEGRGFDFRRHSGLAYQTK